MSSPRLGRGVFVMTRHGRGHYPTPGIRPGMLGRVDLVSNHGGVYVFFAPHGERKLVGQDEVQPIHDLEALAYADMWDVDPPEPIPWWERA